MRFSITTYTYGYRIIDTSTGRQIFCGLGELNETINRLVEE